MYQTLAAILDAAVLDDRIGRSPCRGIRLPAIQPTDRPVLRLRLGECTGLRIGRIDIDRSTVAITEQVTRGAGGRSVLGPPKSLAARSRGLTARDTAAFVFADSEGEHLDYSNWLHRIWYPARQQAGLEWAQFHDLRRANATGLVLEGIDLKTAQTRLGHTDPRLTLGIYAQASTEADRRAAERLGYRFLPKRDHDRGRGLV